MDYTIKVYGYSTKVDGYKYEVIQDSDGAVVHTGVEATAESADIAADIYINQIVTQPIIIRHRSIPEE